MALLFLIVSSLLLRVDMIPLIASPESDACICGNISSEILGLFSSKWSQLWSLRLDGAAPSTRKDGTNIPTIVGAGIGSGDDDEEGGAVLLPVASSDAELFVCSYVIHILSAETINGTCLSVASPKQERAHSAVRDDAQMHEDCSSSALGGSVLAPSSAAAAVETAAKCA